MYMQVLLLSPFLAKSPIQSEMLAAQNCDYIDKNAWALGKINFGFQIVEKKTFS